MFLIVFKKNDNSYVYKFYSFYSFYRPNDVNSYGWVVISTQVLYKGVFIDYNYYKKISAKELERLSKKVIIQKYIEEHFLQIVTLLLLILILLKQFM